MSRCYKRGCFTVKRIAPSDERDGPTLMAYDVAVDTLCNNRKRVSAGADPICHIYLVKMESQTSPTGRILKRQEWPSRWTVYIHIVPRLLFSLSLPSLLPLYIYISVNNNGLLLACHIDKYIAYCRWMTRKTPDGDIYIKRWRPSKYGESYTTYFSLAGPGSDNWTRAHLKRILNYYIQSLFIK